MAGSVGMPTELIIYSGTGPDADPWHPLPQTSARLAGELRDFGPVHSVGSPDELAARLDDAAVLVVNASANRTGPSPADQQFGRLLDGFLARGGGVLAIHSSTIAFPGLQTWHQTVGAIWEHGKTFHPPLDRTLVHRTEVEHPIAAGLGDFWVEDERYSGLAFVDDLVIEPLYVHEHEGVTHPLVWAREHGGGRVVYSALGHDERSYESPEHAELLRRSTEWLRTGIVREQS
ncbi:ThuA domain-containing protein [Kribbella sp. CA-293567]|uniref:ThuA domain-containing protein n=1 Tax=Kribbella sp. CA-293567 TaxID=3002436 RepID=UPI0022DDC4E7|nr:ThuA domain-containing protein [Kribbella sp. CA-293567]WBQ04145.1 ThuA domain-containing protein [Kribbella sp. CA-293567]